MSTPTINLVIKTTRGEVLDAMQTTFVPSIGDTYEGRPIIKRDWETGVSYTGVNTGNLVLAKVTVIVK